MGRRTVGLLLLTGLVAAGVSQTRSNAQEPVRATDDAASRSEQSAGFRVFASRSATDAVVSVLRPTSPAPANDAKSAEAEPVAVIARGPGSASAAESPAASPVVQLSQATPAPNSPAAIVTVTPPAVSAAPAASWPKTLPEAKAEAEARANPEAAPATWPQSEIDLAKARCTAILKGIDAVTIPEPAMRQGDCGSPAPVRLVSVGRNPEVALSPPPILTCDMVVAMHTWVKSDLQPLAKKHLGAAVIKIETMSDYSCRNAYGRTKSRLSEHGKANALDIRGFVTAKGDPAMLLSDWGLTARDIAQQVAAAKAAAEKQAREKAAAEAAALAARAKDKGQPRVPGTSVGRAPSELAAQPGAAGPALGLRDGGETLTEGLPRVRLTIPGTARDDDDDKPRSGPAFGAEPSRLGGPVPPGSMLRVAPDVATVRAEKDAGKNGKAIAPAVPPPATGKQSTPITHAPASSRDQTSGKAKFLREAHASGCRIFGTILGPEANNAHRNHFHVDMAERKTTNFCE